MVQTLAKLKKADLEGFPYDVFATIFESVAGPPSGSLSQRSADPGGLVSFQNDDDSNDVEGGDNNVLPADVIVRCFTYYDQRIVGSKTISHNLVEHTKKVRLPKGSNLLVIKRLIFDTLDTDAARIHNGGHIKLTKVGVDTSLSTCSQYAVN
jgi:hypothetical protein